MSCLLLPFCYITIFPKLFPRHSNTLGCITIKSVDKRRGLYSVYQELYIEILFFFPFRMYATTNFVQKELFIH